MQLDLTYFKSSILKIFFLSVVFFISLTINNVSLADDDEDLPKEAQPHNQINILHINDVNGNIQPVDFIKENEVEGKTTGGFGRIAYFTKTFREKKPFTLFVSGGDVLGPTPFSSRSKGKVVIDMFNMANLDVWSPGTYDFLYGLQELNKRISESKFAVVNTNLFLKSTGKNWIKPYIILEKNKKKIAILGVTELGLLSSMAKDVRDNIEVKDPLEIIKPLAKELKKEVDLVVLIAQLTNDRKSEMLNKTDVDFVVGSINSPSESNITSLSIPNGKFAVSTQGNCWSVGQVTVQWNKDKTIEYKNLKQNMMDIQKYPQELLNKEVPQVISKLKEYENKIDPVIGYFDKSPTREEALGFVANIMRHTTKSDVAIVEKSFFLRGAFLSKDITKEAIYTMIHLPFRIVRVKVSGAALKAYIKNHGFYNLVVAGITDSNVNGINIIDTDQYGIALEESFFKNQIFWKDVVGEVYSEKPINDTVYDFVEGKKNEIIEIDKLNDYSLWKSGFNIDLDPQLLNLNIPSNSPNTYLTWKGDQNAARWGGLFSANLKRLWQKNKFENLMEFELRQQQTGSDKIEKYQDRIKFNSNYTTELMSGLLNPFTNLKISSFFINPTPEKPHPFITEFSGGLSHNLPFGFKFREGIESRKDLFNPASPLQIGAIFGLSLNNTIFFLNETFDSKIYIPFDLSAFVTDVESKTTVPLGSFANLFYKVNLYNESKDFRLWAVRHNIGLSFKFDMPLSF